VESLVKSSCCPSAQGLDLGRTGTVQDLFALLEKFILKGTIFIPIAITASVKRKTTIYKTTFIRYLHSIETHSPFSDS
jgi:hypothetical protein